MQRRPPGTVVSERGAQLTSLKGRFDLLPPQDPAYLTEDILSLPRPVCQTQPPPPPPPIISGDPNSMERLALRPCLTVIDHAKIAQAPQTRAGKRRPKNSLRNNTSSFIARGFVSDTCAKRFKPDDLSNCLALADYARSLTLLDFGQNGNRMEPLSKLVFSKERPICTALNRATASASQLDIIAGISSGDLVWWDLVANKYERVNKQFQQPSAVLVVAWVPQSENLVVAAHANGQLIVYDIYSDEPTRTTLDLGAKATDIAFINPAVALVSSSSDYLKIVDLERGGIIEFVPSQFGKILCCAISHDRRFWAMAGEDDAISIFAIDTRQCIARLVGHSAWVRSVAWDRELHEGGEYRLASVGEDKQVIVWEFSLTTMTQPRNLGFHITPDQQNAARTHNAHNQTDKPVVHGRPLMAQVPKIMPLASTRPRVPEYGELILTSVRFTAQGLLAACKAGRFICWRASKRTNELTA